MKSIRIERVFAQFLSLGAALMAVVFVALLALMLASCAASEEPAGGEIPVPAGLPITFNVPSSPEVEWPTKGTLTNSESLNKVGIYAYSHLSSGLGGGWANVGTSPKADYFLNRTVIRTGGSWGYSGFVKYWPDDSHEVSFFAYAPYSDVGTTIILSPTLTTPVGLPTLTYDTPLDILKQVDLRWASQKNLGITSGTAPTVILLMKPVLAAIYFTITSQRPDDIRVKKLTITNIFSKGILSLAYGTWSAQSVLSQYDQFPNRGLLDEVIRSGSSNQLLSNTAGDNADGFWMFIPQTLKNDSHLIVEFELVDEPGTIETIDIPLPNTINLVAGGSQYLNITIY